MTRSTTGTTTIEDIRTRLQWAMELEHSTLSATSRTTRSGGRLS